MRHNAAFEKKVENIFYSLIIKDLRGYDHFLAFSSYYEVEQNQKKINNFN
jgi:hypothetical protein